MLQLTRQLLRRTVSVLGPCAPLLVAVVLVFVCCIAVFGSNQTRRAASEVQRSARLDDQYQHARSAVAMEAEAHLAYRIRPDEQVRARYNDAATQLNDSLERISATGSSRDRATARAIQRMHRDYLQRDARLFLALDTHDAAMLRDVDAAKVESLFAQVRSAVDKAADTHRVEAEASIAALKKSSRFVAQAVPIAGAIGIAVVTFLTVLMIGYRRHMKRSAQREIAQLEQAAFVDNLTGLGNHRALHDRIEQLVVSTLAASATLAVIALDLDGLKEINDTRGHQDGDKLIKRLAEGLLDTLPEGASAYRVGGDEFIAVLPNHSAVEAFHVSQELQTRLAPPSIGFRAPMETDDSPSTHVTVGICDLSAGGRDAELTLHRADIALIEAKRMHHRGLIWSSGIERVQDLDQNAEDDHQRRLATSLAKAVDAKDSYTRSHCETVAQLCVLIGEQLGMDAHELEQLRMGGLLHDVGKIGVPDAILNKPDRLTDEEYLEMQGHSTLGESIVGAAQMSDQAKWVRHHHERIDGAGYPDNLVGDQIPLQSRIIFVADAFEAITSDRPYRAGSPVEAALIELRRCAGTQFDPTCVAALERALDVQGHDSVVPASATAPPRVLHVVKTDAVETDADDDADEGQIAA